MTVLALVTRDLCWVKARHSLRSGLPASGSDIHWRPDSSESRYWRGCRPCARSCPTPKTCGSMSFSSTIQASIGAVP